MSKLRMGFEADFKILQYFAVQLVAFGCEEIINIGMSTSSGCILRGNAEPS